MSSQVVGALEQLRERISDRSSLTGTLRLGVVGVVAGTWLPALLRVLRARHPALQLELDVGLSKSLVQKLRGVGSGRGHHRRPPRRRRPAMRVRGRGTVHVDGQSIAGRGRARQGPC